VGKDLTDNVNLDGANSDEQVPATQSRGDHGGGQGPICPRRSRGRQRERDSGAEEHDHHDGFPISSMPFASEVVAGCARRGGPPRASVDGRAPKCRLWPGTWKDLTDNVELEWRPTDDQVRNIAEVTHAGQGHLSKEDHGWTTVQGARSWS